MLRKVALGLFSVSLLVGASYATAEDKANPAVLTFKDKKGNKTTYYRSDVLQYKQALPDEIRSAPDEAVFEDIRDQMLVDLLFADAVEADQLENDPEVLSELKQAKLEIMKKIWLKRQLNKMIRDEDLVQSYNKVKESLAGKKVYNTAIIVLDDETKAQDVLKQAQSGKNFEQLAKQHSLESATKERGGEIGFLQEEHLERLLDGDAAKKIKILKDGACSGTVFKKDGRHVIVKKLATKDAEVPEYKQVLPRLKEFEMQKSVGKLAKNLYSKKKADIEVKDFNGKKDTPLKKLAEVK
jgi:peptidyl-prolyl cis-trans isomerase C